MLSKKIITLKISTESYNHILNEIINLAQNRIPSYVCFANVHMTIEAYLDNHFKNQVNAASFVTADGVPLKIATKLLYGVHQDRVAGMDMMPSVISECEKNNLSVAFYGSSTETLNAIKNRIQIQHPLLRIACQIIPPFKELTIQEKKTYIDQINNSDANVVFVCLGCPKQEKWMAENSKHIKSILLGVGGAFGIYANEKKRAPAWMRAIALEWVFRLFQEPRRMFKRYFITNNLFIFLIIKEWFKIKILKKI